MVAGKELRLEMEIFMLPLRTRLDRIKVVGVAMVT
jgi:hypothetical protein